MRRQYETHKRAEGRRVLYCAGKCHAGQAYCTVDIICVSADVSSRSVHYDSVVALTCEGAKQGRFTRQEHLNAMNAFFRTRG